MPSLLYNNYNIPIVKVGLYQVWCSHPILWLSGNWIHDDVYDNGPIMTDDVVECSLLVSLLWPEKRRNGRRIKNSETCHTPGHKKLVAVCRIITPQQRNPIHFNSRYASGKCGGSDFTGLVWPRGSRQGCLVQGITRIILSYQNDPIFGVHDHPISARCKNIMYYKLVQEWQGIYMNLSTLYQTYCPWPLAVFLPNIW